MKVGYMIWPDQECTKKSSGHSHLKQGFKLWALTVNGRSGSQKDRRTKDMLNIFKKKQHIDKQTASEIEAIKADMQRASEQHEASRQQILKNLELINSIL